MDRLADLWPWLAASAALALVVLFVLARYLVSRARVRVPDDAGLLDTLRATPFLVAVFLDLNDLVLDSFGAPVAWWLLSRLGLGRLKTVAVVEALIPGTQLLPLFTLGWLAARALPAPAAPRALKAR